MDKISEILGCNLTGAELISYFSPEMLCVIAILINIILYLFFLKKSYTRKLSDILTCSVFVLNSMILTGVCIENKLMFEGVNFSLLNNIFVFDDTKLLFKLLINVFLALFILISYKMTKKARFNVTLMNSCLLALSICSSFLILCENIIISFMLFDLSAFFIYKYASNMRLRRADVYSVDFVMTSALATLLFYGFYLLLFFTKSYIQTVIVQTCVTSAILLKAGIFPVYNHSLNKNIKDNIPYGVLLFAFLPLLGVEVILKFSQNIDSLNEVYFLTMCLLLLMVMFFSALSAFKTKNIIRFLANCSYIYCSLYILSTFILQDYKIGLFCAFILSFAMLGIYSLTGILKINLKSAKINTRLLYGLFWQNRFFVNLFALSLLVLAGVIPSILFSEHFELIKGIYEFDKTGVYIVVMFLFSNVLIILNALNMIKISYTKRGILKENIILTKKTALNYAVSLVIIVFLVVLLFL